MPITSGVAPHNGWVKIAGQKFQVIRGQVEYNTLSACNTLTATVPLNAPGYFQALANVTGAMTELVEAVVLTRGNEVSLMKAYVKSITFHLTSTTILIQGQDGFSELAELRSTDTWTNQKGEDVAKDLVGRAGLQFSSAAKSAVMAGKKVGNDYVKLTDNLPFLTALHKQAEIDGVRVYMDEQGVVQYRPPGTGGVYQVHWKAPTAQSFMVCDCIDLRVIHNIDASATIQVTVASHKPSTKENTKGVGTVQGTGKTKEYYHDVPNLEQPQAVQQAKAAADRQADHEWELQATVVGDPSIKTDMNVTLSGTGTILDQTYPIDSIIHKFGMDGYTTTMNAKGKGSRGSAS